MAAETTFVHVPSDVERNAGDGGSIRDLGAGRRPHVSVLSQSVLPPSGDARARLRATRGRHYASQALTPGSAARGRWGKLSARFFSFQFRRRDADYNELM
jgi:hypothetical protein